MCNCLDKHSKFGEKHQAFSFHFLSVPRVEGPDHNLWVKFAKQVSSLSFPSCSTSNQIEKKQENYNFRLALSLGNISQKRKHKTRRRNSQHGTLATFMVEILSYQSTFQKATLSARKLYFPNVHLALTKIWQTGFFHSVSVDFFEVAPRLKLGFCGWTLELGNCETQPPASIG